MFSFSIIAILYCANVQVATCFSSNNPFFLSSTNYLNSLPTTPISDEAGLEDEKIQGGVINSGLTSASVSASTSPPAHAHTTTSTTAATSFTPLNQNYLEEVAKNTPDEHYAKEHPGAGWAGYKDPMYGGYLDNLSENTFEEGKKADYGNDIRWGAQVYLDRLGDGNGNDGDVRRN